MLHSCLQDVEVAIRVICKLVIRTLLHNLTVTEHIENVAVADGAESVGDHN